MLITTKIMRLQGQIIESYKREVKALNDLVFCYQRQERIRKRIEDIHNGPLELWYVNNRPILIQVDTRDYLISLQRKLEIERNLHEAFEGWGSFNEVDMELGVRGDIELAIMTPGIIW